MNRRVSGIVCLAVVFVFMAAGCQKPAESDGDSPGGSGFTPVAKASTPERSSEASTEPQSPATTSEKTASTPDNSAMTYDPPIAELQLPFEGNSYGPTLPDDPSERSKPDPSQPLGSATHPASAEPSTEATEPSGPVDERSGQAATEATETEATGPSSGSFEALPAPPSVARFKEIFPQYPSTGYAAVPAQTAPRPYGPPKPPSQLPPQATYPHPAEPGARYSAGPSNAPSPGYAAVSPGVSARVAAPRAPMAHVNSMPYSTLPAGPYAPSTPTYRRMPTWPGVPNANRDSYDPIEENAFRLVRREPLSTFSIDVDTASYSNVRRHIDQGRLPPTDAVRIEELINYFDYDYPAPEGDEPFAVDVQVAPCPWNSEHRLARIGVKGREVRGPRRVPCNLVFLLDVSGSMDEPNKLPLLKTALRMLVNNLSDRDRVGIVVYAGASGLVLPPTSCEVKATALTALERLTAGGGTNGGEGIRLAYRTAKEYFEPNGVNRVILCTDGDFNVGVTDRGELLQMIRKGAQDGVFLTALGFGMGDYQDGTLEQLADNGNGNYAYIDTVHEARKVLVEQMGGTLVTIAKDVKIQVDFNPGHVTSYRLLGYEDRLLQSEDFADDKKDAGEIGAGHTVTALYELVPPGASHNALASYESKYQPRPEADTVHPGEMMTVRFRYKEPDGDESRLLEFPIAATVDSPGQLDEDFKFAGAVACFGMLLRDSSKKGDATYDMAIELAVAGKGQDETGYRSEFLKLLRTAKALAGDSREVATPPAGYPFYRR